MKTGKIKSVAPKMRNGEQASFTGNNGTTFYFVAEMEDGTVGEVGGKTQGAYRFGPGDEVQYEYTPNADPRWMGKLKIEKPGMNGGGRGGYQRAPMGSPARFLLASIIQAGIKSDKWEEALTTALAVLNKVDKPATPPPAPVSNGRPQVAVGAPITDDDDLPF